MKVSELDGALLDYWVARAEGIGVTWNHQGTPKAWIGRYIEGVYAPYCPTTDWEQGGPIIERESITVTDAISRDGEWSAGFVIWMPDHDDWKHGPTPLVAAMRAYVASKIGDTVKE